LILFPPENIRIGLNLILKNTEKTPPKSEKAPTKLFSSVQVVDQRYTVCDNAQIPFSTFSLTPQAQRKSSQKETP
jgi:hypothetical protein